MLPRLATGLSTLVVIQPGSFEQREGQEAAEFSTRNGWAELKEALAREGTVDCAPLSLSAAAAPAAPAGADAAPAPAGVVAAATATEFELVIFRKTVLCLMPS